MGTFLIPQSCNVGPVDPPTCSKSCHLNSISPSSLCLQVSYLWYVGCFQSKFGLAKRYGYRVNDRNLKLVRIRVTSTVLALSRLLAVLAIGALSFAHSQSSARVARSCLCLCGTTLWPVWFVYILLLANRRFEIGRFRLLLSARSWFLEPVPNGPHFYIGSNQKMILTANYIKYSELDIIYDQLTSRNASDDRGSMAFAIEVLPRLSCATCVSIKCLINRW